MSSRNVTESRAGAVELRILGLQLRLQHRHRALCLRQRHIRREPRDAAQHQHSAWRIGRIDFDRAPDLGVDHRAAKGFWHDTDDIRRRAIERDGDPHDGGVRRKAPAPQGMTDHYHRRRAGLVILQRKHASHQRRHTQRREVRARHRRTGQSLGSSLPLRSRPVKFGDQLRTAERPVSADARVLQSIKRPGENTSRAGPPLALRSCQVITRRSGSAYRQRAQQHA